MWNIKGTTLQSIWLSNHYAVHLKQIQNNTECKLWLKNKIKIKETRAFWRMAIFRTGAGNGQDAYGTDCHTR